MTIKPSELEGQELDLAVGARAGLDVRIGASGSVYWVADSGQIYDWKPSTDWKQGGPLIQRERISIIDVDGYDFWKASRMDDKALVITAYGHTALVAAMRCYCSVGEN